MKDFITFFKNLFSHRITSSENKSKYNLYVNVMTEFVETVPRKILYMCWIIFSVLLGVLLGLAVTLVTLTFSNALSISTFHKKRNFLEVMLQQLPLYFIGMIIAAVLLYFFWIKFKFSHQALNEGHKGTSRWTTPQEIAEQYKAIPYKAKVTYAEEPDYYDDYGNPHYPILHVEKYPGLSGTLISRDIKKGIAYIDTGPSHNVIDGRSRSGKTEELVFPNIDIATRSEEQPHLLITSTKYELYSASYEQVEARGYETNVLNLVDPERSVGFNPLSLVTDAYMKNDIGEAIELCKTFSYPLYHNENAREPVWEESAMAGVNGVVLAECYEFIQKPIQEGLPPDPDMVNLYGVGQMFIQLGNAAKDGSNKLDDYFNSLEPSNPARMEYSTVQFAEGQMRSSIFASTQAKLRKFTAPLIAQLTAKTTFDFSKFFVGYDKNETILFKKDFTFKKQDKIIFKVFHKETNELLDTAEVIVGNQNGYLSDEIKIKPLLSVVILNQEKSIHFNVHDNRRVECYVNQVFIEEKIIEKNKPQAFFIILPDYTETNVIIASTFIQQLYYVLSKHASTLPGDKLKRRVRMELDEIGNFDALTSMMSMMSVGAGRGILMNLYIQDDSQMKIRYSDDIAKFIKSQAMNRFFIYSSDDDTRKEFSELLGYKEVITKTRNGEQFGKRSQGEQVEARPLMMPDELARLKEGEVVVFRSGTRQDLKGNRIIPYPIHNDGNSRFLYRYEYLDDQFKATKRPEDLPLPHIEKIDLSHYVNEFARRIKKLVPVSKNTMTQESINEQERVELQSLNEKYKNLEKYKTEENIDINKVFDTTENTLDYLPLETEIIEDNINVVKVIDELLVKEQGLLFKYASLEERINNSYIYNYFLFNFEKQYKEKFEEFVLLTDYPDQLDFLYNYDEIWELYKEVIIQLNATYTEK